MEEDKKNTMQESAIAYPTQPANSMRAILGWGAIADESLFTDLDLIKLTRNGLKKAALFSLASYLDVTMDQLSLLLQTSYRNLQRKDSSEVLDRYKTEKVLELAAFTSRGIQVIGSRAAFQQWIHTPILALGNRKPLEFLDTTFGIQMVLKILGRLEQGVYLSMEVYRITQELFAHDLTGNGARLYGGRWNSEGVFALYASASRSLALLENTVHTPVAILREKNYMIISIYIPDDTEMQVIDVANLPQNWDAFDANPITRDYGNAFFEKAKHLLLKVPSVLIREEFNYILNPLMPAMKAVKIISTRQLIFNDRLLQDF